MSRLLGFVISLALCANIHCETNETEDLTLQQLSEYYEETGNCSCTQVLTTSNGAEVTTDDYGVMNKNPMNNAIFLDEFTHLNRERIPLRVVHAPGYGAFGTFKSNKSLADICRATVFNGSSEVRVVMRISPSFKLLGASDTLRGNLGVGLKFYTTEGNFDLTFFLVPALSIKEPMDMFSLIHASNRNPQTNIPDPNMSWDFIGQYPEAMHSTLYMASPRGLPYSLRHMEAYSQHRFHVYNKTGGSCAITFKLVPCCGLKYMNSTEAATLAASDPYFYTRTFYNDIGSGNYPCWTLCIQRIPFEELTSSPEMADKLSDLTRPLSEETYPLEPIGTVILNEHPSNFFADIEQAAFSPNNLISGILGGIDKIYEVRRMVYHDAQNYRLGANFNNIAVNRPINQVNSYNRDGLPPVRKNFGGAPNYYKNSFCGPATVQEANKPELFQAYQYPANNTEEIRLFLNSLTSDEKAVMVTNTANSLSTAKDFIQEKIMKILTNIDSSVAELIKEAMSSGETSHENMLHK